MRSASLTEVLGRPRFPGLPSSSLRWSRVRLDSVPGRPGTEARAPRKVLSAMALIGAKLTTPIWRLSSCMAVSKLPAAKWSAASDEFCTQMAARSWPPTGTTKPSAAWPTSGSSPSIISPVSDSKMSESCSQLPLPSPGAAARSGSLSDHSPAAGSSWPLSSSPRSSGASTGSVLFSSASLMMPRETSRSGQFSSVSRTTALGGMSRRAALTSTSGTATSASSSAARMRSASSVRPCEIAAT
mmetsp:Transcript_16089/g.40764  ORF Transcript_16089/g.40764 Transcript_16089/m.40764 type:complete len:242 (-) Transcript_16089:97-822(-)